MKNRNFFLVLATLVVVAFSSGCAGQAAAPKAPSQKEAVESVAMESLKGETGGPSGVIWQEAPPPAYPPSPQSPAGPAATFMINDTSGKRPLKEGEEIIISESGMVFFSRHDMKDGCENVAVFNLVKKQEAGVCLVFLAPHLQALKPGNFIASWQVGEEKIGLKIKVVKASEGLSVIHSPNPNFAYEKVTRKGGGAYTPPGEFRLHLSLRPRKPKPPALRAVKASPPGVETSFLN